MKLPVEDLVQACLFCLDERNLMLEGQLKGHKNLAVSWALDLSSGRQPSSLNYLIGPIRKGLTNDLILAHSYQTTTSHWTVKKHSKASGEHIEWWHLGVCRKLRRHARNSIGLCVHQLSTNHIWTRNNSPLQGTKRRKYKGGSEEIRKGGIIFSLRDSIVIEGKAGSLYFFYVVTAFRANKKHTHKGWRYSRRTIHWLGELPFQKRLCPSIFLI